METRVVGPRVVKVCFAVLLLSLAFATPAARADDLPPACDPSCTVYVPALKNAPSPPTLVSPNTDAIESVAPVLSWTTVTTGTYRIQVSTKADLSSPVVNSTVTLGTAASTSSLVITFNLSDSTRYYWRVSVRPTDTATYISSAVGSFVTARKANLPVPPATSLLTPQPRETISVATATATWQAIEGATNYRIKVVEGSDFDNGPTAFSAVVDGSVTSQAISGIQPGKTYTWSVRVLNQYAWSSYAPQRTFTTVP